MDRRITTTRVEPYGARPSASKKRRGNVNEEPAAVPGFFGTLKSTFETWFTYKAQPNMDEPHQDQGVDSSFDTRMEEPAPSPRLTRPLIEAPPTVAPVEPVLESHPILTASNLDFSRPSIDRPLFTPSSTMRMNRRLSNISKLDTTINMDTTTTTKEKPASTNAQVNFEENQSQDVIARAIEKRKEISLVEYEYYVKLLKDRLSEADRIMAASPRNGSKVTLVDATVPSYPMQSNAESIRNTYLRRLPHQADVPKPLAVSSPMSTTIYGGIPPNGSLSSLKRSRHTNGAIERTLSDEEDVLYSDRPPVKRSKEVVDAIKSHLDQMTMPQKSTKKTLSETSSKKYEKTPLPSKSKAVISDESDSGSDSAPAPKMKKTSSVKKAKADSSAVKSKPKPAAKKINLDDDEEDEAPLERRPKEKEIKKVSETPSKKKMTKKDTKKQKDADVISIEEEEEILKTDAELKKAVVPVIDSSKAAIFSKALEAIPDIQPEPKKVEPVVEKVVEKKKPEEPTFKAPTLESSSFSNFTTPATNSFFNFGAKTDEKEKEKEKETEKVVVIEKEKEKPAIVFGDSSLPKVEPSKLFDFGAVKAPEKEKEKEKEEPKEAAKPAFEIPKSIAFEIPKEAPKFDIFSAKVEAPKEIESPKEKEAPKTNIFAAKETTGFNFGSGTTSFFGDASKEKDTSKDNAAFAPTASIFNFGGSTPASGFAIPEPKAAATVVEPPKSTAFDLFKTPEPVAAPTFTVATMDKKPEEPKSTGFVFGNTSAPAIVTPTPAPSIFGASPTFSLDKKDEEPKTAAPIFGTPAPSFGTFAAPAPAISTPTFTLDASPTTGGFNFGAPATNDFKFGSTATATNDFTFGAATSTPAPTEFKFGDTGANFTFGATPAAPAAAPATDFTFGATQMLNFGAPAATPTFEFNAAGPIGFGADIAPSGGGLFNLGASTSTTGRKKVYAKKR